jgi:hypothetical protein
MQLPWNKWWHGIIYVEYTSQNSKKKDQLGKSQRLQDAAPGHTKVRHPEVCFYVKVLQY